MARRRGFLAELQHQSQVAARQREQAQRAATREHEAAVRRAEAAAKRAEQALIQAQRATEQERKRAEQEARRLHTEAKEAEVLSLNTELAEIYEAIDRLLVTTLDVDDYVDLETLRRVAEHPAFEGTALEIPIPPPPPLEAPPEPFYTAPPAPKGVAAIFNRKAHVAAIEQAMASHQAAVTAWRNEVDRIPERQEALTLGHAEAEKQRLEMLDSALRKYQRECEEREHAAAEANTALDALIVGLGYGTREAIEEYVSIVLANSVYPDCFPVEYQSEFAVASSELTLRVEVPDPGQIPSTKAYRYQKSSDEVLATQLSKKDRRDRYTQAILNVSLRSLHEVFEADRRGLIQGISLEVGTHTNDPATGRPAFIPLLAVATARDDFMKIDLSGVVPAATLKHFGAIVSKSPSDLVAIDSAGIRTTR